MVCQQPLTRIAFRQHSRLEAAPLKKYPVVLMNPLYSTFIAVARAHLNRYLCLSGIIITIKRHKRLYSGRKAVTEAIYHRELLKRQNRPVIAPVLQQTGNLERSKQTGPLQYLTRGGIQIYLRPL